MGKVSPSSSDSHRDSTKKSSDGKIARKNNEKARRDEINSWIRTIGELVPFINRDCHFTRKKLDPSVKDKLRMIATFFELINYDAYVKYLKSPKSQTKFLLDMLKANRSELLGDDSFFLCDGFTKFLVVDDQVFKDLGFRQSDLIGNKLMEILIPNDDLEEFKMNLKTIKKEFWSKLSSCPPEKRMEYRLDSCFNCRLLYNQEKGPKSVKQDPKNQPLQRLSTFELSVTIKLLREAPSPDYERVDKGNHHIHLKLLDVPDAENDSQLGIFGQIKSVEVETQIFRHSIFTTEWNQYDLFCDPYGKILGTDQRIFRVLGLCPQNVVSTMAHNFIYHEDLMLALYNHKELMNRRSDVQRAVHRLLNVDGGIVYMKSFGRLYIDESRTGDQLVFRLRVINISQQEGEQLLAEERSRILPHLADLTEAQLALQVAEAANGLSKASSNFNNPVNPVNIHPVDPMNSTTSSPAQSGTTISLENASLPSSNSIHIDNSHQISPPTTSTIPQQIFNYDPPVQSLVCQYLHFVGPDQTFFTPVYISQLNTQLCSQRNNGAENLDGHLVIQKVIMNNPSQQAPHLDNYHVSQPLPSEGRCVNLEPLLDQFRYT